MKEFISIIMDGMQPVYFWVYYFFAFLGLVTYLIIDLWNRNVASERSPVKFSWSFWIKDNYLRVILTLVIVPIAIIMFQEVMGTGITYLGAFILGLATDALISTFKKLKDRIPINGKNYGAEK